MEEVLRRKHGSRFVAKQQFFSDFKVTAPISQMEAVDLYRQNTPVTGYPAYVNVCPQAQESLLL